MRLSPDSPALGAWAGGLVGCIFFASTAGLQVVNPTQYEWLLHGDWSVHFTGWHLFRHAPWTHPVGASPLLAWPVGSSVGLTDSIPIFAVLCKLLNPALPGDFQYVGAWLMLCFILQGVFGALLLRERTRSRVLQVLGALLFIMSPPLISRMVHPALTAHWLLLAGLWLYSRHGAEGPSSSNLAAWAVLVFIAAATHPYIALMMLVLGGAAHFRQILMVPRSAWRVVMHLVVVTLCAALALWQSGLFLARGGGGLQAPGFGFYTMNLLAPIMPMQRSALLGPGPFSFATFGQYEGYMYMGAGMLLLALVAVVSLLHVRRPSWSRQDWQHMPLALACVFLTAMALGPAVSIGSRVVVEYGSEWWGQLTLFRASGRMFWPVHYVLVAAILLTVTRLRHRWAVALFVLALVVQGADLRGSFRELRDIRSFGYRDPLQSRFWKVVPRHYTHLVLVPTNLCARDGYIDPQPFALLAGRQSLSINAGFAARFDSQKASEYCRTLNEELRDGIVSNDVLYIVGRHLVGGLRAAGGTSIVCTTVDSYSVCTTIEKYARWQHDFDIVRSLLPSDEDFEGFYAQLEDEYRVRLRRAPQPVRLPRSERIAALARYLSYRTANCGHTEAATRTLRDLRAEPQLRLCDDFRGVDTLPSANETFEFRRQLELPDGGLTQSPESTHVDMEGEAVWLHAYAQHRVSGLNDRAAGAAVLETIRQLGR